MAREPISLTPQQPFLNDPNQVFGGPVDPMQGMTPEVIEALRRGRGAAGELEDLRDSPRQSRAQQMAQAELGGVEGQGLAATAPTAVEGLGVLAQQFAGNQQLADMQEQAKALRGDITAGQEAEMQAELQRQAFEQQQKRENMMANSRLQQQQARQAQQARKELEQQRADARMELEELRADNERAEEALAENNPGFMDLSVGERRRFNEQYDALDDINDIKQKARRLDQTDRSKLGAMRAAVQTLTPAQFENWASQNLEGQSAELRSYIEAVRKFSAKEINNLYGGQLTGGENQRAMAFMPDAPDLKYGDIARRVDAFGDTAYRRLRQRAFRYDMPSLLEKVEWTPYQEREGDRPHSEQQPGMIETATEGGDFSDWSDERLDAELRKLQQSLEGEN